MMELASVGACYVLVLHFGERSSEGAMYLLTGVLNVT